MKTRNYIINESTELEDANYRHFISKICFMCNQAIYVMDNSMDEIVHIDADIKLYLKHSNGNHAKKHDKFLNEINDFGFPTLEKIHKVLKEDYTRLYEAVMEYYELKKIHNELTKNKKVEIPW